MRIEYTLSENEFVEAQRAHAGWPGRVLPFFGGLLTLASVVNLAQDRNHLSTGVAGILIGGALAFGWRILVSYSYRKDRRLHGKFAATFSDNGIEVLSSSGSSNNAWEGFTRYEETKRLFLFFQGPACFHMFPKNCFAPGECEALRVLVQQKVAGGDNMSRKGLSPAVWVFVVVVAVAFVLMLIVIRNAVRQSAPSSPPAQTQPAN
jgi:hypothetical protein